MIRPALLALMLAASMLAASMPAVAQEFTAPRFPALEQQQATVEQQRLDDLAREQTQGDLFGAAHGEPVTDRALRRLAIDREMDEVRLEGDLLRAQTARGRLAADAALPNRRIARGSVLTLSDPAAAGLRAPPRGQYYARLEGRYVLVDAASELVVEVLPATPFGPQDAPAGPLPQPMTPTPEAGRR